MATKLCKAFYGRLRGRGRVLLSALIPREQIGGCRSVGISAHAPLVMPSWPSPDCLNGRLWQLVAESGSFCENEWADPGAYVTGKVFKLPWIAPRASGLE